MASNSPGEDLPLVANAFGVPDSDGRKRSRGSGDGADDDAAGKLSLLIVSFFYGIPMM